MSDLESVLAVFAGALVIIGIICIAWLVFYYVGCWKLYKKAGEEGWKAIIPFYNTWVFVKMVGLEWYWFLIIMASTIISILGISALSTIAYIVTLFGDICLYYNLSKKCHKETSWFILTIFFNWITIPILGYSNSTNFDNSVVTSPNGFFGGNNNNNANNMNNNPNGNNYTDYNQNNNQNNQGN